MQTNFNSTFSYRSHEITLLNNVKCDATGDVTAEYALTEQDRAFLVGATQNVNGYCLLQISATGVSGSGTPVPAVTITGLSFSIDGTNYANWHTVSGAPVISGTGVTGPTWVSSPFNPNVTKIKLASSAELLTASDFVYVTAKLVCLIAHG
jgi:hypothetical protein